VLANLLGEKNATVNIIEEAHDEDSSTNGKDHGSEDTDSIETTNSSTTAAAASATLKKESPANMSNSQTPLSATTTTSSSSSNSPAEQQQQQPVKFNSPGENKRPLPVAKDKPIAPPPPLTAAPIQSNNNNNQRCIFALVFVFEEHFQMQIFYLQGVYDKVAHFECE
jgi:ABC-type Na+ efflux pump permease subunit